MARNGEHGRPPFPTWLHGDATQTHQLGCLKIANYKRKIILKITQNTKPWGFFFWLLINPSAYWFKMSPSASCRDTGNGQDPDGAPCTRGYVSSDLAACLLLAVPQQRVPFPLPGGWGLCWWATRMPNVLEKPLCDSASRFPHCCS